jgi:DNA-binding transcriptional ArsR family regulator
MSALETPAICCAPLGAPALDEAAALATNVEPLCACGLYEPLGLSQPTVSHHLKKLTDAGFLEREQRGKWAYFSLKRDAVEKLAAVADLKGVCC